MIISRKQAIQSGLKRYYTGKPCKRGHFSERATSNGNCLECHNLRERKKDSQDPLRMTKRNARYYSRHSQKERQRWKNYYEDNRESCIESVRDYQRRNPHVKRSIDARRRAAKLHRTVPWADLEAIKDFYRNCPEGMTVDHVVPLQGERVSGLHVLSNLQYLTPSENSSKGNRIKLEEFSYP